MEERESQALLRWAAGLSLSAALVHGLNVEEHLREWWGYGLFFLFAAAAQTLYGLVLLVRPWRYDHTGGLRDGGRYARALFVSGAVANSFFICLYFVTRTVGVLFFGPLAGRAEQVTRLGILTKSAEALLVCALVILARRTGAGAPGAPGARPEGASGR